MGRLSVSGREVVSIGYGAAAALKAKISVAKRCLARAISSSPPIVMAKVGFLL